MQADTPAERLLNINCGVLGHVDSGKTSLVKALSTQLSTAALDKHPQSRERGITLDLGFSSFAFPLPERLRLEDPEEASKYEAVQLTLVDCPGHASLIRTIIGGAQIIDLVLLVVDVGHGIQNQTAECLIIAEITTNDMIVVLNKIDMLPEGEREERIQQQMKAIRIVLKSTKFASAPIVCIAAAVGGEKVAAGPGRAAPLSSPKSGTGGKTVKDSDASSAAVGEEGEVTGLSEGLRGVTVADDGSPGVYGLGELQTALKDSLHFPKRDAYGPFYFAFDHCFPIKGHGTVLTGTVLSGRVTVGDMIELPEVGQQRKVKSMQMFHQSVKSIAQGDRAGICVTSVDSKSMERGIATEPASFRSMDRCIAVIKKVRSFRTPAKTGSKFHISIGHVTVMARVTFFGAHELQGISSAATATNGNEGARRCHGLSLTHEGSMDVPAISFDWECDYIYQEGLVGKEPGLAEGESSSRGGSSGGGAAAADAGKARPPMAVQYVMLEFESPVLCPMNSLIIGSRLDVETSGAGIGSRIGFYGYVAESLKAEDTKRVKIYKEKVREGSIDRLGEKPGEVMGHGLFKKETDLTIFVGMKIQTEDGQTGVIESRFGKTGKFRAVFPKDLHGAKPGDRLYLRYVKYVNDPTRRMVQRESPAGGSTKSSTSSPLPPPSSSSSVVPPPPPPLVDPTPSAGRDSDDEDQEVEDASSAVSPTPPAAFQERHGVVDVVKPGDLVIVKGLFPIEEDIRLFVGMRVVADVERTEGCIVGPFGKGGKSKVQFQSTFTGAVGATVTLYVPITDR